MEGGFRTVWSHFHGVKALPTTPTDGLVDLPTLERWIRRLRPDVLIDNEERHIFGLLRSAGWRVPAEIGVLSLCAPSVGGPLSGCVQDGESMGVAGVDLLVAMIERHETGVPAKPVTLSTNSVWAAGETLRATA